MLIKGHLTAYLEHRVCVDKDANNDLQSFSKGQNLVESQRVLTISFLSDKSETWFSGIVGAQMKKKVLNVMRLQKMLSFLFYCFLMFVFFYTFFFKNLSIVG